MQYIKREIRDKMDEYIDFLIRRYREEVGWGDTGSANYTLTRIVLGIMKPADDKWTYDSLSDVIKTLECAKLEIARRIIDGYEDKKAWQNGDLKEFE